MARANNNDHTAASLYTAGRTHFDAEPKKLEEAKASFLGAYERAYNDYYYPSVAHEPPRLASYARRLLDIAWYLAQTYHLLEEHGFSLEHLQQCIDLIVTIPTYSPSELAEIYIYKAHVEISESKFDAAIASFEEAVKILEKRKNDVSAQQRLGDALHELADAVYFQGEGDVAAIKMQRDVVEMMAKRGEDDLDAADLLSSVALTQMNVNGDFDAAYNDFGRALEIERAELGEDDIQTAITLNNMAMAKRKKGDYDKAMDLYMDALAVRKKSGGSRSPEVAATMTNMAAVWYYEGDFAMAMKLYGEALQMRKDLKLFAAAADTLGNMAIVCDFQQKYVEAIEHYDQAVELLKTSDLGYESEDCAYALCGKAIVMYKKGDLQTSMDIFRESVRIFEIVLGRDHPYTADAIHGMAQIMYKRQDYERATSMFKEALQIRRRALGLVHPSTYKTLLWITETGRRSRSLIQGNVNCGDETSSGTKDASGDSARDNNNDTPVVPAASESAEGSGAPPRSVPVVRKNLQYAIKKDAQMNGTLQPSQP